MRFLKRYVFVLASNREVGCFFINGSGARMEKVLEMIDALGFRVVIIDKQHNEYYDKITFIIVGFDAICLLRANQHSLKTF